MSFRRRAASKHATVESAKSHTLLTYSGEIREYWQRNLAVAAGSKVTCLASPRHATAATVARLADQRSS
jgi:hypothetical protein